jgi:hypothetical protein
MVFGFLRRSDSAEALARAPSLQEGAAKVYQEAKTRRLPLAYVAERHALGAQYWFADSLLRHASVYGRRRDVTGYTHITRSELGDLKLTNDVSALEGGGASPETQVTDLRTPVRELRRYLRWAQTVQ